MLLFLKERKHEFPQNMSKLNEQESTFADHITENSPEKNSGNCLQVIFREVFCHEYGKIPRHTGQNAITEGDLECILTKLL